MSQMGVHINNLKIEFSKDRRNCRVTRDRGIIRPINDIGTSLGLFNKRCCEVFQWVLLVLPDEAPRRLLL